MFKGNIKEKGYRKHAFEQKVNGRKKKNEITREGCGQKEKMKKREYSS